MSVRHLDGLGARWARVRVAAALLAGAGRADAQPQAVSAAPLSVWYRSSEGCPEGGVFVARLAELGRQATLATVGDRVDFVVTVATSASVSSGRLERQTARGTVAVRELEAPRCEEVMEALALSLEIALEPANTPQGSMASAAASNPPVSRPAAPDVTEAADDTSPASDERGVFGVGVQGNLVSGIAPSWAVGGAAFVERRARQDLAPAMRLSLGAALATDTVAALDVDVLWLAGRVEGCVFELRSGDLSLQPCAGLELGVLRARSPGDEVRTDNGFWGAGVGVLRASLELTKRFALEAQLGAAVPFVRYTVGSSLGGDLYRTEPVSLALAIGGRWEP